MKHVVIDEEARGSDIRPAALLAEMQELARRDAARYLLGDGKQQEVPCPACGIDRSAGSYVKDGFRYITCAGCASIYANPRPTAQALTDYYRDSDAARTRRRYLTESEAREGRNEVLWARARWMCRLMDEAGPRTDRTLVDMFGRYPSLLLELAEQQCFSTIHAHRPEVAPAPGQVAEVIPAGASAVSLFEHLEHAQDPRRTVHEAAAMLRPGGLLFLTTRSGSGFDVALLREHAPSIFPPEHLNLLSVEGLDGMLRAAGFTIVELSTPGQLDVEFVAEALKATPDAAVDPFWRYFFATRDAEAKQDLQYFLQKHRLSSHLRIAAKKTGE